MIIRKYLQIEALNTFAKGFKAEIDSIFLKHSKANGSPSGNEAMQTQIMSGGVPKHLLFISAPNSRRVLNTSNFLRKKTLELSLQQQYSLRKTFQRAFCATESI